MSPLGNSTTASCGISSVPKRVDSSVRVWVVMGSYGLLPKEVEERGLDDRGTRPQCGLVHVLLVGEIEDRLREVGVLGLGEQLGGRRLDGGQARLGGVQAGLGRAERRARLVERVEVVAEVLEVAVAQRVAVDRRVGAQVLGDVAQVVEQLVVAGGLARAEQRR